MIIAHKDLPLFLLSHHFKSKRNPIFYNYGTVATAIKLCARRTTLEAARASVTKLARATLR